MSSPGNTQYNLILVGYILNCKHLEPFDSANTLILKL